MCKGLLIIFLLWSILLLTTYSLSIDSPTILWMHPIWFYSFLWLHQTRNQYKNIEPNWYYSKEILEQLIIFNISLHNLQRIVRWLSLAPLTCVCREFSFSVYWLTPEIMMSLSAVTLLLFVGISMDTVLGEYQLCRFSFLLPKTCGFLKLDGRGISEGNFKF